MAAVYDGRKINAAPPVLGSMYSLIQRGYHARFSGDILVNYLPAWMEYEEKGTTHGTPYSYDTHVPLLFYGKGFNVGQTTRKIEITDIAPTISQLLNIEYPNGCTGIPVSEALKP